MLLWVTTYLSVCVCVSNGCLWNGGLLGRCCSGPWSRMYASPKEQKSKRHVREVRNPRSLSCTQNRFPRCGAGPPAYKLFAIKFYCCWADIITWGGLNSQAVCRNLNLASSFLSVLKSESGKARNPGEGGRISNSKGARWRCNVRQHIRLV